MFLRPTGYISAVRNCPFVLRGKLRGRYYQRASYIQHVDITTLQATSETSIYISYKRPYSVKPKFANMHTNEPRRDSE